ncbi:MAG: helix-turn-helix domain-containing protein [Planctomycetaceae bacterium]
MNRSKKYSDVAHMMGDILGSDDEGFASELADQLKQTQIVRLLATMRNQKGVTQNEIADNLMCRQARVSKLEHGIDDDISIRTLRAYAKACEYNIELMFRTKNSTMVDDIKHYAFCIKRCFEQLTQLAKQDEVVAKGVADFHVEALFNLVNIVKESEERLPARYEKSFEPQIRVEFDDDPDFCDHSGETNKIESSRLEKEFRE